MSVAVRGVVADGERARRRRRTGETGSDLVVSGAREVTCVAAWGSAVAADVTAPAVEAPSACRGGGQRDGGAAGEREEAGLFPVPALDAAVGTVARDRALADHLDRDR